MSRKGLEMGAAKGSRGIPYRNATLLDQLSQLGVVVVLGRGRMILQISGILGLFLSLQDFINPAGLII